MSIYRGPGGAGDATNDATVTEVQQLASEAAASASSAQTSANNASTSAGSASTSATNASNSASAASGSAGTAASSASAAATSATNASNSASAASTSATNAANSATAASNSATSASNSASAASTSATNAANSASAASTSATNSANSAASALAIYGTTQDVEDAITAAETAASNAAGSASLANGDAIDAADSASDALNAAGTAQGHASSAATSASAASVSASNASNSATSASNSAASALAIYGSTAAVEAAVANSQANRDAAAASATAASNSASASATSATASATSATAAATSAAQASAVALGNEPVRHSVRPSLLLDFANTKTLDPRITFTRGSTGTFYDGKTVAKAEENLLLQSQDFDNGTWVTVDQAITRTANSSVAPNGTTTADTIAETAATGTFAVQQALTLLANTTYAFSCFIKDVDVRYVGLHIFGGSSAYAYAEFDLTGVSVNRSGASGTGWSLVSSSITASAQGFYRLTAVITTGTTVSTPRQRIFLSNGSGTIGATTGIPAYTGTNKSAYFWGAQLEQRSSVTAYTATTTAPITNYIPVLQTAAANVARFEHNPVTGESLGLEIEEQRTNLITYSSDLDNAAWGKIGTSVTANTAIAPDGTLTADTVVFSGALNDRLDFATGVLATVGASYTYSVWLKGSGTVSIAVNTTTGLGGSAELTVALTNTWTRYSVTHTYTSGVTGNVRVHGVIIRSASTPTVYAWGAQLEAGAFSSSYIPTVASQVTRSADVAQMTGTNFSSWYRTDEGTMYAQAFTMSTVADDKFIANINNGGFPNRVLMNFNALNNFSASLVSNSVTQSTGTNGVAATVGTFIKGAIAVRRDDIAWSRDANTASTDTSALLPVGVDRLWIGSATTAAFLNGCVAKIAYYPRRLTNSEIQSLTTI
jgi:hypothetical protein